MTLLDPAKYLVTDWPFCNQQNAPSPTDLSVTQKASSPIDFSSPCKVFNYWLTFLQPATSPNLRSLASLQSCNEGDSHWSNLSAATCAIKWPVISWLCCTQQYYQTLSHWQTFPQAGHHLHLTTLSCCTELHSAVPPDTQSLADLSTNYTQPHYQPVPCRTQQYHSVTGWPFHKLIYTQPHYQPVPCRTQQYHSVTSWPFHKLIYTQPHYHPVPCCTQQYHQTLSHQLTFSQTGHGPHSTLNHIRMLYSGQFVCI